MALYHLRASAISRRPKGKAKDGMSCRSVVASAAYRSGSALYDEQAKRSWDYSRKPDIEGSEIIAPEQTPHRLTNRQHLWNAIQAIEKRKDACLARELEMALPRELDQAERVALVHDFVQTELTARGIIADISYHTPISKRDGYENPHVHILYSTRTITPEGLGKKNLMLESKRGALLKQWRQSWEEKVNDHLALAGSDARVDRRSYAERGITQMPEPKIGARAWAMEHKGIPTDRAQHWRETRHTNKLLLDAPIPDLEELIALKALRASPEAQLQRG